MNVLKKEEEIKRGLMYYLKINTITRECDSNLIYTSDEENDYETDNDTNEENSKGEENIKEE